MTRSTHHRTACDRRRLADRVRARPGLEGLERRCLLSLTITEFPVPTANSGPTGITAGLDGNLWFAEGIGNIGMINPVTHAISEFPIPTANGSPRGITTGPDGNLWFTEYSANKIGTINPTTHAITEFPFQTTKTKTSTNPYGIAAGPDGNLWFAQVIGNEIGVINPTTHIISEFPVPNATADPYGIAAGPDGNLWFTEYGGNNIGMINPATHAITEFPLPIANAQPHGIAAGPDGNLWFTEYNAGANKVGMINPATHAITEFPVPTASAGPDGITAGPDGNLWFAEWGAGKIGMIDPATHAITEYPIPYANSVPDLITTGPDGNVWFTDHYTNSAIGVVTLNTNADHFVVIQQPPSSITAGSPFGLMVEAEDSSGNLDSSFNGTVTVGLANNPGGATLSGTLSVTASGGVATFAELTLSKTASGYTPQVSAGGVDGVTTNAMTVTPAAPSQLVITSQPSAMATAGQPFATQPVIYEEDAYGNVETGDNSMVITAALASGAGPLQGTTSVTVAGGVATFTNLADNKAETLTLQFSGGSLTSAPSSSIVVSPAAATKLVITTQPPSSVVLKAGFGLVAAVEDAYGNVVTSASNTVAVALASNPTGARLSGTTKVTASQGLATFTGLSLNKVGSGYTLQVTSNGLTSTTTIPFNVVSSTTSSALAVTTSTTPPNPLLAPLVLDSPDLWDGLVFQRRSRRA